MKDVFWHNSERWIVQVKVGRLEVPAAKANDKQQATSA